MASGADGPVGREDPAWARDPRRGVLRSHLLQRLRADPSDPGWCRLLPDQASREPDPVPGVVPSDRRRLPQGGGRLRRGPRHPDPSLLRSRAQTRRGPSLPRCRPLPGHRRDRPGAGGPARDDRHRCARQRGGGSPLRVSQGRSPRDRLLLLRVGRRVRTELPEVLLLLPLSGEALGERPRVGQTPARGRWDRLHLPRERLRGLRGSRTAPAHLRASVPGEDHRPVRSPVCRCPAAAHRCRSHRRLSTGSCR